MARGLLHACALAVACLAAQVFSLPVCPYLQVGVTVNGSEVITQGTGHDFDTGFTFASYSKNNGTMYMSLATGTATAFTVTVRQMPDPSVDSAGCSPEVSPSSGLLTTAKTPILITYHCTSIGRSRIYLGIMLGDNCLSNAVWNKFSGTALVVASSPSLLSNPDVSNLGVTQPQWTTPQHVYTAAGNAPALFYLSISSSYKRTVQPNSGLGLVAVPKYLSLSPAITPNATLPFTPLGYSVLTIAFGCDNSEDGGAVTVTLNNAPFAPSTFQFFKQCHNAPAFSVDNVDANGGTINKVVRDGELLSPLFNASGPTQVFDTTVGLTYFRGVMANDTFVSAYTTSPTTVGVVNPYNPSDGVCGHSVVGQLSSNKDIINASPAYMNVSYDCAGFNGITQFTAMITATNLTLGNNLPQSSGPISFSWLKACGNAPGFDVTYLSTDGYRNTSSVLSGGASVPGWLPPTDNFTPAPSNTNYTFLPLSAEFLTFVFVQTPPYPPFSLKGELDITMINTTSNPLDPRISGPMTAQVPYVNATPQALYVDIYPKSNSPYIGIVITPYMFNFNTPSFGFFASVVMNENLGLTCVDNGAVVIAGGLVDKNWYLYNGVSRPYKSMSYQLQQLIYKQGNSYVGVPYSRTNMTGACVVGISLGQAAPVLINQDSPPLTISTTFVCEPFHGYVMFTFVLPLVDQSGTHTVSTPLKWTVVFNTNVNTPAAPDAVAQLSITGLSPVSALNKTATATLTFAAPFDHYDPILVYAVRCFDLSVNASLGNDTVVPAPLMPSIVVTVADYSHVYGFQLAAANIDGRGPFSAMVTTDFSASPSPSPSATAASSITPSSSPPPEALLRKRRMNHTISVVAFSLSGLALLAIAAFALSLCRQRAEEEAKRRPPPMVPKAIEISEHSEVSGGNTSRDSSVKKKKSVRSTASKSSRRTVEEKKRDALMDSMLLSGPAPGPLSDSLLASVETSGDSDMIGREGSSGRRKKGGSVRSGRSTKSRVSASNGSPLVTVSEAPGEDEAFVPRPLYAPPPSGKHSVQ